MVGAPAERNAATGEEERMGKDFQVKVGVDATTDGVVIRATVTECDTGEEFASAVVRVEHSTVSELWVLDGGGLLERLKQDAKGVALARARRKLSDASADQDEEGDPLDRA